MRPAKSHASGAGYAAAATADWIADIADDGLPPFDTAATLRSTSSRRAEERSSKSARREGNERRQRQGSNPPAAPKRSVLRPKGAQSGLQGLQGFNSDFDFRLAQPMGNSDFSGSADSVAGKKKAGKFVKRLKKAGVVVFVACYLGLIAYLVLWLFQERSKAEVSGLSDGEACAQVVCPMGSVCTVAVTSGLPRCSGKSENIELVELILGLVLGVPALVCLPCTVQWLVRVGCPRLYKSLIDRISPEAPSVKGRSENDLEAELGSSGLGDAIAAALGESAQPGKMETGKMEKEKEQQHRRRDGQELSKGKSAGSTKKAPASHPGEPQDEEDDELDGLFATVRQSSAKKSSAAAVKKFSPEQGADSSKQEEEDELDLLFAPREAGKPSGASDEEDNSSVAFDRIFAKPKAAAGGGSRSASAEEDNESDAFSELFPRPPRTAEGPEQRQPWRELPPVPESAPCARKGERGNRRVLQPPPSAWSAAPSGGPSEGLLSFLFAAKGSEVCARQRNTAQASDRAAAPQVLEKAASSVGPDSAIIEEEDHQELDDFDLGDPPDFFAFALHLARQGAGSEAGDDARSDVSTADSLAELEPGELPELWHPPLSSAGAEARLTDALKA
ncbi:unnamed protein product [Polarella glacialis]|uniref:Transmembrane protein n=1 Tax=Polarella glacialis TaxID=89957 RepID=A0A813H0Q7_POLGL|nr:unnamed protein product [Polarella glacialis]CAE8690087.1 unnamed protein product [Polarella glacialis]